MTNAIDALVDITPEIQARFEKLSKDMLERLDELWLEFRRPAAFKLTIQVSQLSLPKERRDLYVEWLKATHNIVIRVSPTSGRYVFPNVVKHNIDEVTIAWALADREKAIKVSRNQARNDRNRGIRRDLAKSKKMPSLEAVNESNMCPNCGHIWT